MKKLLKVCALAAFCLPMAAKADNYLPFSNLIAFGDSLTDIGNISGPGKAPVDEGNLYVNYLAQDLGLNVSPSTAGGYDYAYYDANTGVLPFTPSPKPGILTLQQQVDGYLARTHGHADSNALYIVWGGANDIKDGFGYLSSDPSHALTLISASTGNIVSMTQQLNAAGAKYIIVPNLPNLGETPDIKVLGPTFSNEFSTLSTAYDNQLLSSLNAIGNNVIQVDIFGLLNALQANYEKFGFVGPYSSYKYTTILGDITCFSGSPFTCSTDPSKDIFYDGFHPSEATNKIGADLIFSQLQGPGFASTLAEAPISVMDGQNQQIQSQLLGIQTGETNVPAHQWHIFATGVHNQENYSSHYLLQPDYTQDGNGFTVGVDYRLAPDLLTGVAVGRSMGKLNFAHHAGGFDITENMINLFGGYQFLGNAYVDGSLGIGNIDYSNIRRNFMLGIFPETVTGETSGQAYAAFLQTGYNFKLLNDALKTGPLASLDYQRITVNPYAETSANFQTPNGAFDALQYEKQANNSFIGALGWQASYAMQVNTVTLLPFVQASYNHQFLKAVNNVEAGVTSLPGSFYSLPIQYPNAGFELVNAGIQGKLSNGVALTFGYSRTFGPSELRSQLFTLSASVPL
jgi:outer membrane lipase/esterase